jgi:hypothetical protein
VRSSVYGYYQCAHSLIHNHRSRSAASIATDSHIGAVSVIVRGTRRNAKCKLLLSHSVLC